MQRTLHHVRSAPTCAHSKKVNPSGWQDSARVDWDGLRARHGRRSAGQFSARAASWTSFRPHPPTPSASNCSAKRSKACADSMRPAAVARRARTSHYHARRRSHGPARQQAAEHIRAWDTEHLPEDIGRMSSVMARCKRRAIQRHRVLFAILYSEPASC